MSTREIPLDELEDFCDTLARQTMKEHERRFVEKIKAVNEAAFGLQMAADRLSSGVKNAWGTLDKTASEYGLRLAQVIRERSASIPRKDTGSNYQDAERFHAGSVQALNEIIISVRKYVPKIGRRLKTEMAALNSALSKLEIAIRALGNAIDESPGSKLESLQRQMHILKERYAQLLTLREKHHDETASLTACSTKENELRLEKQALNAQPEFAELEQQEETLRAKEEEIRQFLQPLTKPLVKLERVSSSDRNSKTNLATLRSLVENPIGTVLESPSFALAELLDLLQQALDQGRIEIEERKRRRATEAIKAAKEKTLQKFREEYLALQANVQETLRQLRSKGLLGKMDELNRLLAETESQTGTHEARQTELKRRIDDVTSLIMKDKATLEASVNKIAHESISVTVL